MKKHFRWIWVLAAFASVGWQQSVLKDSAVLIAEGNTLILSKAQVRHGINASHIQKLKSLKMKIMVPGYVPPRFKVVAVGVKNTPLDHPGGGPAYLITYTGSLQRSFSIEAVSSGIGEPPSDETVNIKSYFGQIQFYTQKAKNYGSLEDSYLTEWIGRGPFYHFLSPGLDTKTHPRPLSKAEAMKVVKYLSWLK